MNCAFDCVTDSLCFLTDFDMTDLHAVQERLRSVQDILDGHIPDAMVTRETKLVSSWIEEAFTILKVVEADLDELSDQPTRANLNLRAELKKYRFRLSAIQDRLELDIGPPNTLPAMPETAESSLPSKPDDAVQRKDEVRGSASSKSSSYDYFIRSQVGSSGSQDQSKLKDLDLEMYGLEERRGRNQVILRRIAVRRLRIYWALLTVFLVLLAAGVAGMGVWMNENNFPWSSK